MRNIVLNGRYIVVSIVIENRKGNNILLQKKKITFFFFRFSFQTRKDLALVKFYNAAVRCFLINGQVEYVPCTSKTGKILLFIMYVLFLKITRFLGLTLILHPGHTSLFLESVKIRFMGPRGRGPTYGAEGREKQIPVFSYHVVVSAL